MGPHGNKYGKQTNMETNKYRKQTKQGIWPPKQVGNLSRQHRVDPLCHRPALHHPLHYITLHYILHHPPHVMCRRLQYMHITVDDIYIAY